MSDTTAQPRFDFPNQGSLGGLLDQHANSIAKKTEDMLPATIISYDRASNMAVVQPAIQMVTTDGVLVKRAPIASVSVLALGGGGYTVNFPLKPGSRGWIKASDRDISLYMQSGKMAAPNSQRMHSFSDGLFIPDVVGGFVINSADTDSLVIQSLDGLTRIAVTANEINMTATNVTINGTLHVTADAVINGRSFNSHVHVNSGGNGNGGPPL